MQTLPFAHGLLASNDYGVGIVDNTVADGISQNRSDNFSGQPGMSNWEQKIVEFRLYGDSTISNKSLASVSFKGYRSHSSIMSNAYFLYWAMSLQTVPLPLAIWNSTSRSGSQMYFTT